MNILKAINIYKKERYNKATSLSLEYDWTINKISIFLLLSLFVLQLVLLSSTQALESIEDSKTQNFTTPLIYFNSEMHLWPTKNLRDSFKISYLRRLEWNNRRMEMEKDQQSSTEQKLLENDNQDNSNGQAPNLLNCEAGSVTSLFHEVLLVLSCCYCCFCCGGN